MRMVLAGMVSVAAALAVVLGLGFWIHERTTAIPDSLFGILAAVAIAVVAAVILCLLLGFSPWRYGEPSGHGVMCPIFNRSNAPCGSPACR